MILENLSDAEYDTLRDTHTTAHALIDLARDPAIYAYNWRPRRKHAPTAAMTLGTAMHTLTLGDTGLHERYLVSDGPINSKTGRPYGAETKAYAEWVADISGGREVISTAQAAVLERMRNQVSAVSKIATYNKRETALTGEYSGLKLLGRPDAYDNRTEIVADLKTTASLDTFRFDIDKRGYHLQLGFYALLLEQNGCPVRSAELVAVESVEPYRAGVWKLFKHTVEEAKECVIDFLDELKARLDSGNFRSKYATPSFWGFPTN